MEMMVSIGGILSLVWYMLLIIYIIDIIDVYHNTSRWYSKWIVIVGIILLSIVNLNLVNKLSHGEVSILISYIVIVILLSYMYYDLHKGVKKTKTSLALVIIAPSLLVTYLVYII